MRPYRFDPKVKAYAVKDARGQTVYRRNRTAAGMTYTNGRKPKPGYSDDCLQLMVKGYIGNLPVLAYRTKRDDTKRCPCCGQASTKLKLNDAGLRRLKWLRRKYKRET